MTNPNLEKLGVQDLPEEMTKGRLSQNDIDKIWTSIDLDFQYTHRAKLTMFVREVEKHLFPVTSSSDHN